VKKKSGEKKKKIPHLLTLFQKKKKHNKGWPYLNVFVLMVRNATTSYWEREKKKLNLRSFNQIRFSDCVFKYLQILLPAGKIKTTRYV
jgi:hypothetical protein